MPKPRHVEFSSSSDLYLQLIQLIMSFLCSMLCSCTEFEFIQGTGLHTLRILNMSKLRNFLVGANKSQMREEEDIPSANLRLACNSFNNFLGPTGFLCLTDLNLSRCPRIKGGLDSCMQPDYFPVLTSLNLSYTGIVTIPESISRFTTLQKLEIRDCKKLWKIPRLPQSIRTVDAQNCNRLDTQSSNRLLNQFGEILGILPNTIAQVATFFESDYLLIDSDYLLLPAIEIPKWFVFNHHESVGNSVSFLVGPKFSNLVVCIVLPSSDKVLRWEVRISINGEKQFTRILWWPNGNYEHVWLIYGKVNISNPSEENRIEVKNAYVVLRNPIYLLPHLWINVLSTMGKKIQAALESDADCEEETIDQPMLDVPQNTTLDGFESDTNFGNEAPNPGDG
ncbi:disease resistance protein rml1b [Quercus suber]|uniref:Disease resistance protein rml1b n=1 Tax=Quercus suber TaxID=58331 RepID=A0AAW0K0T1_QUESU